ncbi:unnamed protein product, partial [Mesorhabditis belari]|uniref:G protein-coupled receptor n=1 Tax=Mesorhabditis belari TaxID=2138241 RepID=A0AAF3EXC3_9BILA
MNLQLLMYIDMRIAVRDRMETFIYLSYAIEMGCYLTTCVTVPLVHLIFGKTSLFHPNIQFIFLIILYSTYPFIVARAGVLYLESQTNSTCETYAESFDKCPTAIIGFSLFLGALYLFRPALFVVMLIERIIAMRMVATYETRYYRSSIISMSILAGILALIGSTAFTFSLLPRLVVLFIVLCLSLPSAFMILWMIRMTSRRKRALLLKDSAEYTLSKSYQLRENHRSMQVRGGKGGALHTQKTLPVLSAIFWVYIIAISTYMAQFYAHMMAVSWTTRNIIGMAMGVQMGANFAFLPFLTIGLKGQELHLAKSTLIEKVFLCLTRKTEPDRKVKNKIFVHGKKLYTGANQEDYFVQLEAQWATPTPRSR